MSVSLELNLFRASQPTAQIRHAELEEGALEFMINGN